MPPDSTIAEPPEQASARLLRLDHAHLDEEKRDFYSRMPRMPLALERGRVAKKWMPTGGRLLDVGCSAGYHVRHLARRSSAVGAIDVDPVVLAMARRQVTSSKVDFLHYDGRRLPFADASFDVVSMLDVLEHVPDKSNIIAEVARVLRPGGTWIVSVPHKGPLAGLSPENMRTDHPRAFAAVSRLAHVRFWIRGHNGTGLRHAHFSPAELESLVGSRFALDRSTRRGSLLYAIAYSALCFPPRALRRSTWWAGACFAAMALDYQIPYGPLAYNLVMRFRRKDEG